MEKSTIFPPCERCLLTCGLGSIYLCTNTMASPHQEPVPFCCFSFLGQNPCHSTGKIQFFTTSKSSHNLTTLVVPTPTALAQSHTFHPNIVVFFFLFTAVVPGIQLALVRSDVGHACLLSGINVVGVSGIRISSAKFPGAARIFTLLPSLRIVSRSSEVIW